jgi:long-chain acyl-CoA synthetase
MKGGMQMDQPDSLSILLDEWVDLPRGNPAAGALAPAILAEAEARLAGENPADLPPDAWHRYLDLSGRPAFLQALPDDAARERWAETTFLAIRRSRYTLADMFRQRLADCPDRLYLQEFRGDTPIGWTYARVWERLRAFAAALRGTGATEPRLVILANNSLAGASADLAALCFDIPVAPLDPHLDDPALADILGRFGATVALGDTPEHCRRLVRQAGRSLRVLSLADEADPGGDWEPLAAAAAALAPAEVDGRLAAARRRDVDEIATVLFTSGSTGRPKGVAFSMYNLITKRFARAAALPAVGDGEVLLCYLPLYHTFGRFLELLGTLYWRGTYVRLDNPAFDTLRARLPLVRPTGLIGVPQRWSQLHEHCLRQMPSSGDRSAAEEAVRAVTGGRLRWGLSAAGFLDPAVFTFFQGFGVELGSGFGMTEASGGITMTPPGDYEAGSVGRPLPGTRVRLTQEGELQVSGPYIARYLEEVNLDDPAGQVRTAEDGRWLATGDLFRQRPSGHLEIVDRLKDIYKNRRGQTIAPQRVEQKFQGVPGIRRTFLVGDGREDNVLLVVPDRADALFRELGSDEAFLDYCRQLAAAANRALAPPERVVEVALLPRDFEAARGELTPKGSYRRKVIEDHFSDLIAGLYRRSSELEVPGGARVRLPRWLLRDMGLLESDIAAESGGLRLGGARIRISPGGVPDRLRIGDLEYRLDGPLIDLGVLVQQPRLWLGNPALAAALPCRPGWDRPLGAFGEAVHLPPPGEPIDTDAPPRTDFLTDVRLVELHGLLGRALLAPADESLAALEALAERLLECAEAPAEAIRQRLAALARHPAERIRCTAYRILLLDEPRPDHAQIFPAFIEAGESFLDDRSMDELALADLGRRRLESLRIRLHQYRRQMAGPIPETARRQFERIFRLLANFVHHHPDYYYPVRAELTAWSLIEADRELARRAECELEDLFRWYEATLAAAVAPLPAEEWAARLVFDDGLTPGEQSRLEAALMGTTFLQESIRLIFDTDAFNSADIAPGGAWVSRLSAPAVDFQPFRLSLNLRTGDHFDLQILLADDLADPERRATLRRLIAVSGHPAGSPVLPRFGCFRPDLGAVSTADTGGLSVWDRFRECSARHGFAGEDDTWRRLFVQAMAVFFRAWEISGGILVAGAVSPANVVVPDAGDQESGILLSLGGWSPYRDTLSLVQPMWQNFFRRTAAHYPRCAGRLSPQWILDAVLEGLDRPAADEFLNRLGHDLAELPPEDPLAALRPELDAFIAELARRYHVPLAVGNAAAAYHDWRAGNPAASPAAHRDFLARLAELHRLDRFPELARFHF